MPSLTAINMLSCPPFSYTSARHPHTYPLYRRHTLAHSTLCSATAPARVISPPSRHARNSSARRPRTRGYNNRNLVSDLFAISNQQTFPRHVPFHEQRATRRTRSLLYSRSLRPDIYTGFRFRFFRFCRVAKSEGSVEHICGGGCCCGCQA